MDAFLFVHTYSNTSYLQTLPLCIFRLTSPIDPYIMGSNPAVTFFSKFITIIICCFLALMTGNITKYCELSFSNTFSLDINVLDLLLSSVFGFEPCSSVF